jgi:hypothetical protein
MTAKMAGFLYLIFIVTFASSTFIQSNPIVSGDVAATAGNIMAHVWLFRVGFISELLSAVFSQKMHFKYKAAQLRLLCDRSDLEDLP